MVRLDARFAQRASAAKRRVRRKHSGMTPVNQAEIHHSLAASQIKDLAATSEVFDKNYVSGSKTSLTLLSVDFIR